MDNIVHQLARRAHKRLDFAHIQRPVRFFGAREAGSTTLQLLFLPFATTLQLLVNYFRKRQKYMVARTWIFTCVCGGCLGCQVSGDPPTPQPTSVSVFECRGERQSLHSQLQAAYLSAVRTCDHVKTSSASAKWQIARGFHVYTTHKVGANLGFAENPGFSVFQVVWDICRISSSLQVVCKVVASGKK